LYKQFNARRFVSLWTLNASFFFPFFNTTSFSGESNNKHHCLSSSFSRADTQHCFSSLFGFCLFLFVCLFAYLFVGVHKSSVHHRIIIIIVRDTTMSRQPKQSNAKHWAMNASAGACKADHCGPNGLCTGAWQEGLQRGAEIEFVTYHKLRMYHTIPCHTLDVSFCPPVARRHETLFSVRLITKIIKPLSEESERHLFLNTLTIVFDLKHGFPKLLRSGTECAENLPSTYSGIHGFFHV
jgi:hypothetical protein